MPKKNSTQRSMAKSAELTTTDKSTPPTSPKLTEDNPRRRFEDTFKARRFGSDKDGDLANLRASAISAARAISPFHESNLTPATPGASNWVELGPNGIPNGQTYGGARVIVTGRVTEIVQHPTDASIIYVATSRGGVWKTEDAGVTW